MLDEQIRQSGWCKFESHLGFSFLQSNWGRKFYFCCRNLKLSFDTLWVDSNLKSGASLRFAKIRRDLWSQEGMLFSRREWLVVWSRPNWEPRASTWACRRIARPHKRHPYQRAGISDRRLREIRTLKRSRRAEFLPEVGERRRSPF